MSHDNPLIFAEYNNDQAHAYLSEDALLGCLLYAADDCLPHLKWFKANYFMLHINSAIYQCTVDLYNRGESVDLLTVTEELRFRDQLVFIGGPYHLTELVNSVPTHINVLTYANAVYESWRKRETLDLAGRMAKAALASDTEGALGIAKDMTALIGQGYQSINPLKPYFIKADELKNLPPISWLIENEIPEMGLIALYGPPGIGKSFVALDYALRLAQEKTVVYIASEGQAGYARRVEAWCRFHKLAEGNLYFLLKDISMLDDTERTQFVDLISELKPCMVIIDTLAQSMSGGDENSTRDMSLFIRMTGRIRSDLSCAVMLVHHTGKQGGVERGSSVLRGACDTMIKLIDKDDQIEIECNKMKDAQPFETRFMTLLPVEVSPGEFVPVIIPDKKKMRSEDDAPTQRQQKVLRALSGATFIDGVGQAELADASNIPSGSIWQIMNGLMLRKMAIKKGQSFVITDKGRSYLRELGQLEYDPPPPTNSIATRQQLVLVNPHNDAGTRPTRSDVDQLWETELESPIELTELTELSSSERENNSTTRSRQTEFISLSSTAPRTPCPVCGETNYTPDKIFGWKCRTCDTRRRQLDETAEV